MKKNKRYMSGMILLICAFLLSAAFPALAEEEGYGPYYAAEAAKRAASLPAEICPGYIKGESLGMFVTTGYCSCELCCGGNSLTFSGTVPLANHTISADLTLFPLGTKLLIDNIVYTVEDKGSAVVGDKLDIFWDTHAEALEHGTQNQEVFAVILTDSQIE